MVDINISNNVSFAIIVFIIGIKLYFSLAEIIVLLVVVFSVFLRLKVLILIDEDRFGVLLAIRITRICNGGTIVKVVAFYIIMLIVASNLLRVRNGIVSIIIINNNKKFFNVSLIERFVSLSSR